MVDKYKFYYYTFITVFWIAMTWGFITDEIFPFLEAVKPMLYLVIDAVLVFLGFATLRQRGDVAVVLSFFVLAILSTVILNHLSLLFLFNGLRDFIGLIFVVPILRYFFNSPNGVEFRAKFDRQLYILLCLQAFCLVFQFIRYGAGDHGGGTFGFGGSGIVSMMVYMLSFYFISQRWDSSNFARSFMANKKYILLLIPTFLNETKASFLLLILYFILLLKFDRKAVLRLIFITPLFIAAFIGVVSLYMNVTNQEADEVFSEEFVTNYLYGENLEDLAEIGMMVQDGEFDMDARNWWEEDIPRFGKIVLVWPMLKEGSGGLWFGRGVGQFKGGTIVDNTDFYKKNQWLMFGSKPLTFTLLVQLGFSGIIWFLLVIFRDLYAKGSRRPMHRQMLIFLWACVTLVMMYNDSMREFCFCAVFFYIALSLKYYNQLENAQQPEASTVSDADREASPAGEMQPS